MPLDLEKLQTYEVPPGYKSKECNGDDCTARVYWVRPAGSSGPVPVRCDSVIVYKGEAVNLTTLGLRHPTAAEHGRGINHFVDCPNSRRFHKKGGDKDAGSPRRTVDPDRAASTASSPAPEPAPAAGGQVAGHIDPSGAIAGNIGPRTLEDAFSEAIARQHNAAKAAGVLCTERECDEFAVVAVLKHARLLSAPCITHADSIVAAAVDGGSCTTAPVTDYLDNTEHPEWRAAFIARVKEVRDRNATAQLEPQSHGERRTGGTDGDGRARR